MGMAILVWFSLVYACLYVCMCGARYLTNICRTMNNVSVRHYRSLLTAHRLFFGLWDGKMCEIGGWLG